jgi:hypothetical protein
MNVQPWGLVMEMARPALRVLILGVMFTFLSGAAIGAASELSDDEIRDILIQQSISRYSGNCPCPYNTDRAGRRCGKRSAYSKPGGASPLCYPQDVTEEMIERYRKLNE